MLNFWSGKRNRNRLFHRLFAFLCSPKASRDRRGPQRDRALARGVQARDQHQTVLPSAETAAMLFWALPRVRLNHNAQSKRLALAEPLVAGVSVDLAA
jgi:hypothetical protein